MTPQKISIITPSYGQLDWLRLCIASVADQVGAGCESGNVKGAVTDAKQRPGQQKVGSSESNNLRTFGLSNLSTNPLAIEHIIQDGGTPGIEEFARELGYGNQAAGKRRGRLA